jgi:class 3 adenylate cyclase
MGCGVGGLWMVAVLPAYSRRGKARGGPMVVAGAGAGLGWRCPRRADAGDRLLGCWMSGLPSGSVTFLFSDIEGSTRLVKALRDGYAELLAEHQRLVRAAIAAHAGHEMDTQGDAFFVAFGGAKQAVLCALQVQRILAAQEWPGGAAVRARKGSGCSP